MSYTEQGTDTLWMARINHRWLSRLVFAAWLFPIATLLNASLLLVTIVAWRFPVQWGAPLAGLAANLQVYAPALPVVAVWMLTVPQRSSETPAVPSRAWGRWLSMVIFLSPIVVAFVPALAGDWYRPIARTVSAVANVCVLFMLRQYAMQYQDVFAAKLLRLAAVAGIVTILIGLVIEAVPWQRLDPEPWAMLLGMATLTIALAFGAVFQWAAIRFALGFQRASRSARPLVCVKGVMIAAIAATALGGVAGWVVQQLIEVQARRATESLATSLAIASWSAPDLGMLLGVAVLPSALQKLYRVYRRRC